MTCASCGCHGGAWTGEVCLYRTADKRLDVQWWRDDGPVLMSAADVRLYDDTMVQPLTDVLIEPGRVSFVIHMADLDAFDETATLEVLASDELGLRMLLMQSAVRIAHSEAILPDGASKLTARPLPSFAYAGAPPRGPETTEGPERLALTRGRKPNGNGGNGGNGGGSLLL